MTNALLTHPPKTEWGGKTPPSNIFRVHLHLSILMGVLRLPITGGEESPQYFKQGAEVCPLLGVQMHSKIADLEVQMHPKPGRNEMKNQQAGLTQFREKAAKRVRTPSQGGKPKCKSCGYRVRGDNHDEGNHHQQGGKQGKGSKRARLRRR